MSYKLISKKLPMNKVIYLKAYLKLYNFLFYNQLLINLNQLDRMLLSKFVKPH